MKYLSARFSLCSETKHNVWKYIICKHQNFSAAPENHQNFSLQMAKASARNSEYRVASKGSSSTETENSETYQYICYFRNSNSPHNCCCRFEHSWEYYSLTASFNQRISETQYFQTSTVLKLNQSRTKTKYVSTRFPLCLKIKHGNIWCKHFLQTKHQAEAAYHARMVYKELRKTQV